MDKNKKIIAKISAAFVVILLLLTFFSNTIFNFNLTNVSVDFAREGVLSRSAEGRGIAEFAEVDEFFADIAGRVEVFVSEGDFVYAGDRLYTIFADIEDMQLRLEGNLLDEERILRRIDGAEADLQRARANLNNMVGQIIQNEFDSSEFDFEIGRLNSAIESAEEELEQLIALFELGVIPRMEVDNQRDLIEGLQSQLYLQHERKQRAIENFERNLGDSERILANTRRELQSVIDGVELRIREHEFELNVNRRESDRLREQIVHNAEITVSAERDGLVREIGIAPGRYAGRNERILNIGAVESGFKAVVYLPETVDFLNVGDTAAISIRARNILSIPGSIHSLMFVEGRLRAEVRFESSEVSGGETVEVRAEHISTLFPTIVPNNAIGTDSFGDFVLIAEMVEGTLRNEYFARRISATVISQDSRNSAVLLFTAEERLPIIMNSDRIVSEGERIRIVSGSDLVGIR